MPTLLFIHGFATGPHIWEAQIKEFSKDFDVAFEVEKVDHTKDVIVVGWSMGGWKALDLFAEKHLKIRGMVLVSAFVKYVKSDDYPCGTSLSLLRKLEKKFMGDYKEGMHYFYDLIFKDKGRHKLIDLLPPPEKEDIIRWFDKLRNEDKRDLLPKIDIPVLIIQGEKDPIVSPDAAKYLKEKIKDSELHIFPGAGHASFLDEEVKFNRYLRDFLNKCGRIKKR
jgi:pimeloyl-ACP methyl ester carboxylesterase